jgi:hypothetical protein
MDWTKLRGSGGRRDYTAITRRRWLEAEGNEESGFGFKRLQGHRNLSPIVAFYVVMRVPCALDARVHYVLVY